jgi:hypothetical protein
MRRFVIACLLALAAGVAASASADAPRARLRSFVCQQALDPAARAISVTAVMRPLPGTAKLAMRFELLKRAKRYGHWTSVAGTGLRSWLTPPRSDPALGSRPGDVWVLKHPVVTLAAPDFYRFRVTFRWSDAASHTIGRAVRVSAVCFQPELRPDLVVQRVTIAPLAPGQDRYRADIRNAGKTAAGSFEVQLADGSTVQNHTVVRLAANRTTQVSFKAPACSAGHSVTVTADPGNVLDDADRGNNSLTVACPAAQTSWRLHGAR